MSSIALDGPKKGSRPSSGGTYQRTGGYHRGKPAKQPDILVSPSEAELTSAMTDGQLVEALADHPNVEKSAIADELRARTANKACVVFDSNGNVDIVLTLKVIAGIKCGDDYGLVFRQGRIRHDLYRVGFTPSVMRDEHPLYPQIGLNIDSTDANGIAWGNVSLECKQFIRICLETREIRNLAGEQVQDLRDLARNHGLEKLITRYPLAAKEFDRRRLLRSLPTLKTFAGSKWKRVEK